MEELPFDLRSLTRAASFSNMAASAICRASSILFLDSKFLACKFFIRSSSSLFTSRTFDRSF